MNGRRALTVLGTGVTTTILVSVLVTALLDGPIEFSAIIGLPAGLLAGVVAIGGTLAVVDRFDTPVGAALGGYAAFGYAVVACMGLRYANVAGARRVLGLSRIVGIALVATGVVSVGLWYMDRRDRG